MLIKRCLCLISLLFNISFISCQNYESIHQVVLRRTMILLVSHYIRMMEKVKVNILYHHMDILS